MGKIKSLNKAQTVMIKCENGGYDITVIAPEIFQIQNLNHDDYQSYAVEERPDVPTPFQVEKTADQTIVKTSRMKLVVDHSGNIDAYDAQGNLLVADYRGSRTPLARKMSEEWQQLLEAEGHKPVLTKSAAKVEVVKQLHPHEHFYGLGDKPGFMDKRGYEYDEWATDLGHADAENQSKMYKDIPFIIGLNEGQAYGLFFDNTYFAHFDLGKESDDYFYYTAVDGQLDYYIIGGQDMAAVVSNYGCLTGYTLLPQKWTLGYQQSRNSYYTDSEVRALIKNFRQYKIPCDAIHLDIDYMNAYRVFTVNKKAFPDMAKLTADAQHQGIKLITIIDPGVKKDDNYSVFAEGKKNNFFGTTPEGKIYFNRVWPGASAFPDFGRQEVRQWWAHNTKTLTDQGIAGIWNDMNEPSSFDGELADDTVFHAEKRKTTIKELHNVFGHNMDRATYAGLKQNTGKRPFVISRAAYPGTQKYSTVWTGDNSSIWGHLQWLIPQLCNLGVSGFSFAGTDIGGFGADTTPELLSRWIEAALFSPLFRNHSCAGTRMQEPWHFGESTTAIYRHYVELRYRLIDYLYDLIESGTRTGLPVMRPLILHDSKDEIAATINDEYMAGDSIVVAPVVTQGTRLRLVYLPAGSWFDFWTGEQIEGGKFIQAEAPIDRLPMYVKANTILPWRPLTQYVDVAQETELTFRVFGDQGSYLHYQDNGEDFAYQKGAFNRYQVDYASGNASVKLQHFGYEKPYTTITIKAADQTLSFHWNQASKQYVKA